VAVMAGSDSMIVNPRVYDTGGIPWPPLEIALFNPAIHRLVTWTKPPYCSVPNTNPVLQTHPSTDNPLRFWPSYPSTSPDWDNLLSAL
jgi:hypothetical protein